MPRHGHAAAETPCSAQSETRGKSIAIQALCLYLYFSETVRWREGAPMTRRSTVAIAAVDVSPQSSAPKASAGHGVPRHELYHG